MKTILKLMIMTSCMFIANLNGFALTITVNSVAPSSTCYGSTTPVTIIFTKSGAGNFQNGNTFTAELSDASGSFSSPTVIGTLLGKTVNPISATIPLNTPAGTGYLIRIKSSNPALTSTNAVSLIINTLPGDIEAITGLTTECENATGVVYSISSVANAIGYTWTVPIGATVASGQGTTSITVDFGTTSGNVTVTPTNSCGNGGQASEAITLITCGTTELKPIYRKTYVSYIEKLACYIVSGAQQYEWEFTPSGGGIPLTYNWGINNPSILLGWIPGIQDGTTYDVRIRAKISGVFGSFGNTWQITTPLSASQTQIINIFCGKIYTSYAELLNTYAVTNATEYEFEFSPVGGGTVVNYVNTGNSILLSWATGLINNTSYNVRVKAKVSGIYGSYGSSCQITTPSSSVITSLKSSYCGVTYTSMSNKIACYTVTGAEDYEWEFTPVGGGITLLDTGISTSPSILLNMIPGIQVGTSYDVRIRPKLSGVYGSFGLSCQITTPSTAMVLNETARLMSNNEMEAGVITPLTTLHIYPNPNIGEQLSVNLENLPPNSTLAITDIYGKVILNKPLNTELSEYNIEVKFDNKLASGLYFINIVSDGNRITEKLIVR